MLVRGNSFEQLEKVTQTDLQENTNTVSREANFERP